MLADLGLLYCALFWGASFPTMKILVGVYPPCWLLFMRFSVSSILLYIFFHKRINKSFFQVLKPGAVIGILLFLAIFTQTVALKYIGGGRSAFISAIYVLMVPLILWVLRRVFPGWITLFAACLCVAGMYFLTSGEELTGSMNYGDFLTVICAFTFAVQVIAISLYTKDCDPIALSFAEFLVFAGVALACSLFLESPAELINVKSLPELIFTITFCTFGCYTVQIYAQKYAEPSHATIIMSLESVFGLASSIIFLGETVTLKAGFGCALIFSAVLISELAPIMSKNRG